MTRGPARLDVSVSYALPRAGVPAANSFRKWVAAALHGRIREADLAIRLVDAREGRALNRHYRGRDYATNVLTFVMREEPLVEGDLALCAPVIAREARARRKSAAAHYAHLVVHGVLHLQGYDHESAPGARKMERRESSIVARLGYPDPYGTRNR
jgi:probable rRNA maturation factor